MSWNGAYNGGWYGGWFADGGTPPPAIVVAKWRVRHLGLGVGLVYIPRPVSALA
jgi:hypothetical protein